MFNSINTLPIFDTFEESVNSKTKVNDQVKLLLETVPLIVSSV